MPPFDVEQYQAYRLYSEVSFSPDGRWIAYATTRVQNGAHATILQQPVLPEPDGQPVMPLELTLERPATQWGAAWSPDGERIVTTAFRTGTTSIHLHETPPHHGSRKRSTVVYMRAKYSSGSRADVCAAPHSTRPR